MNLLLLLSVIDVLTGIIKAWKIGKLRSRTAWLGYVRKMLSFVVVIVANIIDQIMTLNGVLTLGTVLFYIANEGLSIVENLAQIGVEIPASITDRLHVIESDSQKEESEKRKLLSSRRLFSIKKMIGEIEYDKENYA